MGFVSLCTPLESGGAVHSEIHQVNKKAEIGLRLGLPRGAHPETIL